MGYKINQSQITLFRRNLLRWFSSKQRKFLWRRNISAYGIFIAEMMLRKTKAETVNQVLPIFLKKYPSFKSLQKAHIKSLEKTIRPLGLYRVRARAFKDISRIVVEQHHSKLPKNYDEIYSLPHVGRYITNAYLCQCRGERRPIVDNNIVRLYGRIFGVKKPIEVHKDEKLWRFAEEVLPLKNCDKFNLALLDLSAITCLPQKPKCHECPVSKICGHSCSSEYRN